MQYGLSLRPDIVAANPPDDGKEKQQKSGKMKGAINKIIKKNTDQDINNKNINKITMIVRMRMTGSHSGTR